MIVKIDNLLEKSFWEYVSYEEIINLFIIGYVENYGFNNKFQSVWLQLEDNDITSVILKRHSKLTIYSYKNDFDIDELICHIEGLKVSIIDGKKSVIDRFLERYDSLKYKKERSFCTLKEARNIEFGDISKYKIKRASSKDIESIYIFLGSLGRSMGLKSIEEKKLELEDGKIRVYFIEEKGKIITTVSTGIETSFLAELVDLGFCDNKKGVKLSKYLVYILSKELIDEGKRPCVFYDGMDYKEIYDCVGYKKESDWITLSRYNK